MTTLTADSLPDVPVNVYWIVSYTTAGYPPGAASRTWAQLVITTQDSPDLTAEKAAAIAVETRQDARDVTLLGPFDTAQIAAEQQRRWLAKSPSPVHFYSTVQVETLDGQPPHPLAIQYAARALALGQPMLDFDDRSPIVTITIATVSDELRAAFDSPGWVISAFGATEAYVKFRSVTVETAAAYLERTDPA